MAKAQLVAGDRITYTRNCLRSLGGTYDIAQRRGTYVGPYSGKYTDRTGLSARLCYVQWDDMPEQSAILSENICRVGPSVAFAG